MFLELLREQHAERSSRCPPPPAAQGADKQEAAGATAEREATPV